MKNVNPMTGFTYPAARGSAIGTSGNFLCRIRAARFSHTKEGQPALVEKNGRVLILIDSPLGYGPYAYDVTDRGGPVGSELHTPAAKQLMKEAARYFLEMYLEENI